MILKVVQFILLFLFFYSGPLYGYPPVYTEKMDSTPDMTQTDAQANLPGGGKPYCGPVAVSNSFAWLADHGFDKLVLDLTDPKESQADVACLLGTVRYMDTSLKNGTGTARLLNGVSRYIRNRGYEYKRLEYQGWKKHPSEFSTGVSVPQLDWIKNGLIGDSAVWLNIGWYKYTRRKDRYRRKGGHWVTLVGFGIDRDGRKDPNVFVIHDPAPMAGEEFSHNFVRFERIESGKLVEKKSRRSRKSRRKRNRSQVKLKDKGFGLPRSAVGYYKLTGEMHLKKRADFAILDGAVVLQMR
jgi:hypothetical protein